MRTRSLSFNLDHEQLTGCKSVEAAASSNGTKKGILKFRNLQNIEHYQSATVENKLFQEPDEGQH